MIEKIRKAGLDISSIYDLVNYSKSYAKVIPILVAELRKNIPNDKYKEGIIRALAVKEAKGIANDVLFEEYNKIPANFLMMKWVIGNTIEVIAEDQDLERIINIISDKKNGMSRERFVSALRKYKPEKIKKILSGLLDDDEVAVFAIEVVHKLKLSEFKDRILKLSKHENNLIKSEAIKTLKCL